MHTSKMVYAYLQDSVLHILAQWCTCTCKMVYVYLQDGVHLPYKTVYMHDGVHVLV